MTKIYGLAAGLMMMAAAPAFADTWVRCANEAATCTFDGTKTVRFGVDGKYNVKQATGSIFCSSAAFGDPQYGVLKTCDVLVSGDAAPVTTTPVATTPTTTTPVPSTTTDGWVACAKEGATCTFDGTKKVRFGVSGKYNVKQVTGSILCSSSTFGDPQYGVVKSCDVQTASTSTTPTNPTTTAPVTTAPVAGSGSGFVPANYALTFADEFNSLSTISNGPVPYTPAIKWYNGLAQCCMGASDGKPGSMYPTLVNRTTLVNPFSLDPLGGLNITLSRIGDWWNSAVMQSVDGNHVGFSQKYGYFEMAAQFPSAPGTWPAFWMLPVDEKPNHGEIDIFEGYTQFKNGVCTTLHDWDNDANSKQNCFNTFGADLTAGYHVYGMLWTAQTMTFYIDGQQIYQAPTLKVMNAPYYMLVDLGLGGGWPTTSTPATNVMKVKYVRAYAAR